MVTPKEGVVCLNECSDSRKGKRFNDMDVGARWTGVKAIVLVLKVSVMSDGSEVTGGCTQFDIYRFRNNRGQFRKQLPRDNTNTVT